MTFLKTVFIIVLVYYLIKFLVKIFGPRILKYAAKKTQERFKDAFDKQNGFSEQNTNTSEGDISVENPRPASKKFNKSKPVGDYIDFEEIE